MIITNLLEKKFGSEAEQIVTDIAQALRVDLEEVENHGVQKLEELVERLTKDKKLVFTFSVEVVDRPQQ